MIRGSDVTLDVPSTVAQAARKGDVEALRRLIEKGHPVDVKDNRGWTSLHEAAYGSHLQCLQELLKHEGTDIAAVSHEGCTALLIAAQQGNVDIATTLLSNKANPNTADVMNNTPLIAAVTSGKVELVDLLLEHNAGVDSQLYCGTTALHQAVSEGMVEITSHLLAAGASLHTLEDENITPVFSAARYGKPKCLKLLIEAARERNELSVLDKQTSDGGTPVYIAAQEGYIECLELLIHNGANASLMTTTMPKLLPLHAAVSKTHRRCVDLLMQHTDMTLLPACTYTLLQVALDRRSSEMFFMLLMKGVDPNYMHNDTIHQAREMYMEIDDPNSPQYIQQHVRSQIGTITMVLAQWAYDWFIGNRAPEDIYLHKSAVTALLAAGTRCDVDPMKQTHPLLYAIDFCEECQMEETVMSLVLRGGAPVTMTTEYTGCNAVALHAVTTPNILHQLLHHGAECTSLLTFDLGCNPPANKWDLYKNLNKQFINQRKTLQAVETIFKYCKSVAYNDVCRRIRSLFQNDQHRTKFDQLCQQNTGPRRLQYLTRLAIRSQFTPQQLSNFKILVSQLKVPDIMEKYLCYE